VVLPIFPCQSVFRSLFPPSLLRRNVTNEDPEGIAMRQVFSIARPESRRETPYPMINELITEMVDAGVHYGHQTKKWNPRMKPYLMKDKGGIYIINLEKTVQQLDKAADFLADLVGKGKKVLFVGCKRQAQDAIREAAEATGQHYVNHRWLGGMLTNSLTVRKSVERLKYLENIEKQPEFKAMSKKELAALGREREKLLRNLRGVRDMDKKPDAVVIVDSARETIAVAEARRLEIPIVALVDTNADPAVVDFPIPGNDDAIRSIRIILQNLVDAMVAARKA
jgi:small subunit ribosomal protein S2